ncbi:hypothetical protein SCHPADRAFT_935576 [Schizopora paradoxa]|uniref:Zn(2)-C6 fungal-type domain-containing protein n=1 Tax=Schizopora paradoxa TaxID=27342 RepID=A0A0H2S4V7_9AGAM|nr:hypothetical protein SCHPADRAFT_935576 [Schizopora paradoxa]
MDYNLVPFIIPPPSPMPNLNLQNNTTRTKAGQAQMLGTQTLEVTVDRRKRRSQRNRAPCGGCSARKIRCVRVSDLDQPSLCKACKRRGLNICEPHLPWKVARERIKLCPSDSHSRSSSISTKTNVAGKPMRPLQVLDPTTSTSSTLQRDHATSGGQPVMLRHQSPEHLAAETFAWTFDNDPTAGSASLIGQSLLQSLSGYDVPFQMFNL